MTRRKDFEDHLLSWYGLMTCGVVVTGIGLLVLSAVDFSAFSFDAYESSEEFEMSVYGLIFAISILLIGAAAIVWGLVRLALDIRHRVKKLSSRR